VRGLSRDEVDHRERVGRRVGKEPEYEWTNDARSVTGVEAVGGSERDEDEPGGEREITAEKSGHKKC
jgi:hypothetical protein